MEPRHNQNNEIKTLKRLDNQLSYQGNMYSVQVLLSKMAFGLTLKFVLSVALQRSRFRQEDAANHGCWCCRHGLGAHT